MTQRAEFQRNYLLRYAIISGALLFFAAYFAYDGFIGYPSKLPAARAYDELSDLNDEQRTERWQQITQEKGWDNAAPTKTAEEIEADINEQYFFGVACLIGGCIGLSYYFRSKDSWVESTQDGLNTSWGQQVRFADVTRLDKKRWARKGIAKATYTEAGAERKFIFDDFKFDREPLGKMLRTLEDVLDREQIVGGPTEAETDEQKRIEAEEEARSEENHDSDLPGDASHAESEQKEASAKE